ncbi:hypothetical protein GF342_02720 [Candidatus Woesearchaeota archaeon]|nr:hypothetical protein [Candidatus Woesearchaeota archaeon]
MRLANLVQDIAAQLRPSPTHEKAYQHTIGLFLTQINKQLQATHLKAKAVLGGSFAKGTWLAEEFDVDIFVLFDNSYPDTELSDLLERALQPFSPTRVHGSRDYYHINDKTIRYEIVPVTAIDKPEQARNVTDFSPLHVQWVQKNAGTLRDDIRVAKQWFKAQRLYGAESYLHGFSGHVLDILVIHYKGFLALLRKSKEWTAPVILDPEKHYKGRILHHLNKSKTQGPLIIVDPLDKTRNAAAAVGQNTFIRFKKQAQAFLDAPSADAFTLPVITIKELKTKADIIIEAKAKKGKVDVVGTKLYKVHEHLIRALQDFKIITADWHWKPGKTALLWYTVKHHTLSKTKEVQGPPLNIKEAVKRFKQKHPRTYEKSGRLYATVNRTHRTPHSTIQAALKSTYVTSRVMQTKILKAPKDL